MSETVHYRGIATEVNQPHDKTLIEVAKGILEERGEEIATYHNDALDCLCDAFYDEYFYHPKTQTLYKITKTGCDPDGDIIKAEKLDNGTIEYELRYYNGGAGFSECLEEALDKIQ